MRSSHLQKFIWNGPISKNVSLWVISDVVKFRAFIIKLNNFWSITARLAEAILKSSFFLGAGISHNPPAFFSFVVLSGHEEVHVLHHM